MTKSGTFIFRIPKTQQRPVGLFFWLLPAALCWLQPAALEAQSPVWRLRAGDVFVVDVLHEKATTVTLSEADPVTLNTRDYLQLQYLVRDVDPSGDMTVEAQVVQSRRGDSSSAQSVSLDASRRLQLLEGAAVSLRVAPDGVVDAVAEGDRRTLVNQLSGLDGQIAATLNDVLQTETLIGLLGRPFWCVRPVVRDEPQSLWTRQDRISLGLCGHLQTTVQCELSGDGPQHSLTIDGEARFVPRLATATADSGVAFQDVKLNEIRYSGEGTMLIRPEDRERESGYRPHFDNLKLVVEYIGTATLSAGERAVPLAFEQRQTIQLKLDSWRTGPPTLVVPGDPPLEDPR